MPPCAQGLPPGSATDAFAKDLLSRLPSSRKGKASTSAHSKQVRAAMQRLNRPPLCGVANSHVSASAAAVQGDKKAAALARKNATYGMLEDSEEVREGAMWRWGWVGGAWVGWTSRLGGALSLGLTGLGRLLQDEPPPKLREASPTEEKKKKKKKIRKAKAVEDDGEDDTVVQRRSDKRKWEAEGDAAEKEEDLERLREEERERDQRCACRAAAGTAPCPPRPSL